MEHAYLIYLKCGLGLWLVGAAALQINDHASIPWKRRAANTLPLPASCQVLVNLVTVQPLLYV